MGIGDKKPVTNKEIYSSSFDQMFSGLSAVSESLGSIAKLSSSSAGSFGIDRSIRSTSRALDELRSNALQMKNLLLNQ